MLMGSVLLAATSLGLPAQWVLEPLLVSPAKRHWRLIEPTLSRRELFAALMPVGCDKSHQDTHVWFCLKDNNIWSITRLDQAWILSLVDPNQNADVQVLGLHGHQVFSVIEGGYQVQVVLMAAPVGRVRKSIQFRYQQRLQRQFLVPKKGRMEGVQMMLSDPERYIHLEPFADATLLLLWQVQS